MPDNRLTVRSVLMYLLEYGGFVYTKSLYTQSWNENFGCVLFSSLWLTLIKSNRFKCRLKVSKHREKLGKIPWNVP